MPFVLDYLLQNVCMVCSLGILGSVSLLRSKGPACLLLYRKDWLPKPVEFLPCNAAHCMCKCYLALVVSPVVIRSGNWIKGQAISNPIMMITVSNKDLSI